MDNSKRIRRLLGLRADASKAEYEKRCEYLMDWLESDDIPDDLVTWASRQADLVHEIYVGLTEPEGQNKAPILPDAEPATSVKRSVGQRQKPRLSIGLRSGLLAFVAAVFVLGLVVTGGLWLSGVISSDDQVTTTFANTGNPESAGFLASRQDRIAELIDVVAVNSHDAEALFELGETHMLGGDWEQATIWFKRLLDVEPTNLHAVLDIGTASMNLSVFSEAETFFTRALTLDPGNTQAHYNMGYLMAFRTDEPRHEEALRHWEEVIRLEPESDLAEIASVHIDELGEIGPDESIPE